MVDGFAAIANLSEWRSPYLVSSSTRKCQRKKGGLARQLTGGQLKSLQVCRLRVLATPHLSHTCMIRRQ
jgi:hypothetical protein